MDINLTRLLIFVFLLLNFSCLKNEANKASSPSKWKKLEIQLPYSVESLGSIDVLIDSKGCVHTVATVKVYDSFKLYYFVKDGKSITIHELKTSRHRFYHVLGGSNHNNFLKLHLDQNGDPLIFFVDTEYKLIRVTYRDDFVEEEELAGEVGTFNSIYNGETNELHLAYLDVSQRIDVVHYAKYIDGLLVLSQQFSHGFSSTTTVPSHLEILLDQDAPIILLNTGIGKMLMIKDNGIQVVAQGINHQTIFNAYWVNGQIRTCFQDRQDEWFELMLDPYGDLSKASKINFRLNNPYPPHCFVSSDEIFPFLRYDNYQPYKNELEFFQPQTGREGVIKGLSLLEIKMLKLEGEKILAAGLDFETRNPTIYIKE